MLHPTGVNAEDAKDSKYVQELLVIQAFLENALIICSSAQHVENTGRFPSRMRFLI